MPDSIAWLGLGFLAAWLLIGGYVVRLWLAQRDIARRLQRLEHGTAKPSNE